MAMFNHNTILFWALIKQSKEHVNLTDLMLMDNHPPAHSREYDLSGLNLKRFYLAGGGSLKLNLAGSDLSEAMLSCHSLDGSDFRGANLHLADLSGSCSYANFKDVDLSQMKFFYVHSSIYGADFRGAILTSEMKHHLKRCFFGKMPKSYKAVDKYLYKKSKDLIFDFDYYVYAILLTGAKSKKEFAEIMKCVPEKLKIKEYWLFGTRTRASSYWKVIKNVLKTMPDIVSKPMTTSPEIKQIEEKVHYYVPSRLEEYCRDYHKKPVPNYIASILVKVIRDTAFLDPSYKLIEQADVSRFIFTIALKGINLKDETLDGIASELRTCASHWQLDPTPKQIIQSIEALKAEFFIKKFKATRSLPEVSESKEPIFSSTTSVFSGLSSSALDSGLNKHPLFEEIFIMLDSKFKERLEHYMKMMAMGLVRKDQVEMNEATLECRKVCAEELLKIWEHRNEGCLSASSVELAAQSERLKDQAALLGYELAK